MSHFRRLQSLDSLRAIAALAVLSFHYFKHSYYGLLGVELFFVISGFVILMTIERVSSVFEFALGRFARLYPAYWLSVLIAGSLVWAAGKTDIKTILVNATMLERFFQVPYLIDPFWTLAYELWFYFVIAALFLSNQLRNLDYIAIAWTLAATLLHFAMIIFGRGFNLYSDPFFKLMFMPQFAQFFISGMMLHKVATAQASTTTYIALSFSILYSSFGRSDWAEVG